MSESLIDGGQEPVIDPDAPPLAEQEPEGPLERDEAPVVTADQVAEVFDFAGQLLNMAATSRGGGPEDVFTFTPKELALLGRAGESYVARHARLAAVAEKSDVLIIAGVNAKMLRRELGRYRAYKAAQDAAGGELGAERVDFGIKPEPS